MARRIIGLDLGAYSVKLLRMETGKQSAKYEIINVAEEVLIPEEEDGPGLMERQKEALLKLHNAGILEAEAYASGINSIDGQIRWLGVPFAEARKIEAVLPGILESEVPFDISEMIISWHRIESASQEKKQPGENKIRLGVCKKSSIATSLQLLQSNNIDPRQIHLSSVAPYEIIREFGIHSIVPSQAEELPSDCGAIVDFGHRATNLCIFDHQGISAIHTFYRGGKKLTQDIAKAMEISFAEAELLKHEKLDFSKDSDDAIAKKVNDIAALHYRELFSQIQRVIITHQSSGTAAVKALAFAGGGAKCPGLENLCKSLVESGITIARLSAFFPSKVEPNTMILAFAYSLSLLSPSVKDSRFNFRKDEFVWRGELDFLRTKSVPLTLWGLSIICLLTIMWSAMSLVLDKENKTLTNKLKQTCSAILGKPNVNSKQCLSAMKEQISSHVDFGIPEFSASDVYIKLAESLSPEVKIVINEMDILEKRVRLSAQSPSYEDIDKVTSVLRKAPCFIKLETGRTEKTEKGVKYNISFDLDCSSSSPTKAG
ncbi:MAG: pilus assembly protein PilM [Myxococcales bacterium]|nr:pilus assembly protein PilM [Myxococcales bacterium]USN49889.1 MAG: pilus assembly protein PilM [Myxococcales bacterium]